MAKEKAKPQGEISEGKFWEIIGKQEAQARAVLIDLKELREKIEAHRAAGYSVHFLIDERGNVFLDFRKKPPLGFPGTR